MQEGAIQGWLDTIDEKRAVIKDRDAKIEKLEMELQNLQLKNQQQGKRLNNIELDLAEAIQRENMKTNENIELKKLYETEKAEKQQLQSQINLNQSADLNKEEKIQRLMSELADERMALSDAQAQLADKQIKLDGQSKINQELKRSTQRAEQQIKQVEDSLRKVNMELKEFQDQKKLEDMLTVKLEMDEDILT